MGFCTSLQAGWLLIVQDIPGALGTRCPLSLENWASMAPCPREASRRRKLVPLPTFSCFLSSLYCLTPAAVSATTAASHIQTPQKRQCLGSVSHYSVKNITVRQPYAGLHRGDHCPLATGRIAASFLKESCGRGKCWWIPGPRLGESQVPSFVPLQGSPFIMKPVQAALQETPFP